MDYLAGKRHIFSPWKGDLRFGVLCFFERET